MNKCPYCGRESKPFSSNSEDHCFWVGDLAKRLGGVRSISCYEAELAAMRDIINRLEMQAPSSNFTAYKKCKDREAR